MTSAAAVPVLTARRRLWLSWVDRPFTVTVGVLLPIPGVLALIYGIEVSKAFTTIGAGLVVRVLGGALLLGGMAVTAGVARGQTLMEVVGLVVLAAGCGIYGIGVILGLGLGGAIAGSGFLAIAIAAVRQVMTMVDGDPDGDDSG